MVHGRDKWDSRWLLAPVCLAYGLMLLLDAPCLFSAWLGIPCPGCGMRRALAAALALDLGAAFRYHPMFWSLPVLALSVWRNGRLTGRRRTDLALHAALALGFLLHYAAVLLPAL